MAHNSIRKTCSHCGKQYIATSGVAKFCSDRCHILASASPVGDCLIWQAGFDKDGYGVVKLRGGRRRKAHRASYEEFVGEIPAGAMVCHSCDTPACIKPSHLFLGSAHDNKADCVAKDRHVRGPRMYWKTKLSEDQVRAILKDDRSGAAVGREYGVTKETVYAIRHRKIWKHLDI